MLFWRACGMANIRDLIQGLPEQLKEGATIWDVATTPSEDAIYEDPDDPTLTCYSRMPGDASDHPALALLPKNPMPEMGVIEMFKALTEGRIPPAKQRAVRAYLAWKAS